MYHVYHYHVSLHLLKCCVYTNFIFTLYSNQCTLVTTKILNIPLVIQLRGSVLVLHLLKPLCMIHGWLHNKYTWNLGMKDNYTILELSKERKRFNSISWIYQQLLLMINQSVRLNVRNHSNLLNLSKVQPELPIQKSFMIDSTIIFKCIAIMYMYYTSSIPIRQHVVAIQPQITIFQ